ncbi:MAG: helix-turn-helix domain-containing protein [Clostridia bacterium]|nr:helix-turn-helix domain-containing protein [Clostridia bacterium]MBP3596573.1 helix-turn-helix domain-containing protein [Clostridia bacterium]
MFNNFNLSDEQVLYIIKKYKNLINRYSKINGEIDEDLKQEIILNIYKTLTKNKKLSDF